MQLSRHKTKGRQAGAGESSESPHVPLAMRPCPIATHAHASQPGPTARKPKGRHETARYASFRRHITRCSVPR